MISSYLRAFNSCDDVVVGVRARRDAAFDLRADGFLEQRQRLGQQVLALA